MNAVERLEPDAQGAMTARWVAGLFVMCILLQRFAIPGTPVALLLPAIVVWGVVAWRRGVVVVDQTRAMLWLAAFGVTALVIPVQARFVQGTFISITSWGLFMAVWSPFVLRLVDRRMSTYLRMLHAVSTACTWLAVVTISMTVSQLAGVPYVDWFAKIVPNALELRGFVITYPISYGGTIYRSNAWIGLEPSMISAQLGLGVLAALYARRSPWLLGVLVLGLVCTSSGSGFAILTVGLVVLLVHPSRRWLRRYAPIAVGAVLLGLSTSLGALVVGRVTEFQSSQSSTSLRAIEPYRVLWPTWVQNVPGVLLGHGPGSSQDLASNTNTLGLLVPSPIKVFFDYGLVAGTVLAVFLFTCYAAGPSRGFAVGLLVSLWLLQPGTTTTLIVSQVLVFVTLWSPRIDTLLELRPAQSSRPARELSGARA